jgi:hypothetical protein
MHPLAMLLLGTAMFAILGCDTVQDQTVAVALSRGALPAVAAKVRLYPLQNCLGSFQELTTSSDGRVQFVRTAEIGGVGVITDELSVCIESGVSWTPLLSSLHGPAPALIELSCDLGAPIPRCSVAFDGRPQDDLSTERHDT